MVYANFYILYKYSMTSYITDTQTTLKDILIQCICQQAHNESNDSKQDISIESRIRSLKTYERVRLSVWIYEMTYRMDFLCFNRSTKWLARFRELLDILEHELDQVSRDRLELPITKSKLPLKSSNLLYQVYRELWTWHLKSDANLHKRSYLQNALSQLWAKKEKKSSKKSHSKTWKTTSQSGIVIRR